MSLKLPKAMQIALQLTRRGHLAGATRAIQKALFRHQEGESEPADSASWTELQRTADTESTSAETSSARTPRPLHEVVEALGQLKQRIFRERPSPELRKRPAPSIPPGARFETRSIGSVEGNRSFKIYMPARFLAEPRTLLIMLHGCTQNPDTQRLSMLIWAVEKL